MISHFKTFLAFYLTSFIIIWTVLTHKICWIVCQFKWQEEPPPPHNVFSFILTAYPLLFYSLFLFCKHVLIVQLLLCPCMYIMYLDLVAFLLALLCCSHFFHWFPNQYSFHLCFHKDAIGLSTSGFTAYFRVFLEQHSPATVFPQITSFCPFPWEEYDKCQAVTLFIHQTLYVRHHAISILRLSCFRWKLWLYNLKYSGIISTVSINCACLKLCTIHYFYWSLGFCKDVYPSTLIREIYIG